MDNQDYSTEFAERKKGQHLRMEDRGAIKALKQEGLGVRAIARRLGCAPSTVSDELKRGTPPRKSSKGRPPGYSPKRGEAVYKANRANCHRPRKADSSKKFIAWVVGQVREHKWSLHACVGRARREKLFERSEMVCTRTLYDMAWSGLLPLHIMELPQAVKRRTKQRKSRENKKHYGASISQRPKIAAQRTEAGHWEGDTVVGKRAGKEAVILSLLEKKTQMYLAFRIPGKDSKSVMACMEALRSTFGKHFPQVFKTITWDNGSEFAECARLEEWGAKVFFAHPYTSWERAQNEQHNGMLRTFVPKGASIAQFSDEYILSAADELNGLPRRNLGYRTPEELFDAFLDAVYAA